MKALLLALLITDLALSASAQSNGTLSYQTTAGTGRERYVFGFDTLIHRAPLQASLNVLDFEGLPKLEGTGYSAQLYYSLNPASSEGSLLPVPGSLVDFRTGNLAGLIRGKPELEIPFTRGGDVVALQLRAWDNRGGLYTSYEAAGIKGQSQVFTFQLAGIGESGQEFLGDGSIANKMYHFQIFPIPEPSLLGLGALVAWAWIVRGRSR